MLSGAPLRPYTAARFAQTANDRGPQGAFVPLCPGRLNRNASLRVSYAPIVARCPTRPVAFGLLLYRRASASWFENYACLSTRDVVLLAGCSFLFAAIFMPRISSGSDRHLCIVARSASRSRRSRLCPIPSLKSRMPQQANKKPRHKQPIRSSTMSKHP